MSSSILARIGTSRVRMAHFFWRHTIEDGDTVIDATCGRGKDCLELARLVQKNGSEKSGFVIGFDIQKAAINETWTRLSENKIDMSKVRLFHEGHENIWERSQREKDVFNNVKLVSFNLGYLPGGNKDIQTKVDTTLMAVEGSSKLLVPGGVISIVQYPHEEGANEAKALREWYNSLPPQDWMVTNMMEGEGQPSIVFLIRRLQNPAPL